MTYGKMRVTFYLKGVTSPKSDPLFKVTPSTLKVTLIMYNVIPFGKK